MMPRSAVPAVRIPVMYSRHFGVPYSRTASSLDRVHGRADFVAHAGENVRLVPVRLLRPHPRNGEPEKNENEYRRQDETESGENGRRRVRGAGIGGPGHDDADVPVVRHTPEGDDDIAAVDIDDALRGDESPAENAPGNVPIAGAEIAEQAAHECLPRVRDHDHVFVQHHDGTVIGGAEVPDSVPEPRHVQIDGDHAAVAAVRAVDIADGGEDEAAVAAGFVVPVRLGVGCLAGLLIPHARVVPLAFLRLVPGRGVVHAEAVDEFTVQVAVYSLERYSPGSAPPHPPAGVPEKAPQFIRRRVPVKQFPHALGSLIDDDLRLGQPRHDACLGGQHGVVEVVDALPPHNLADGEVAHRHHEEERQNDEKDLRTVRRERPLP